ncbi:MAG TPA: endonuclease/exonuclease/phosphatase family protein [Chloroflexota bacterium]
MIVSAAIVTYVLLLVTCLSAYALDLAITGWAAAVRELILYLFVPAPFLLLTAVCFQTRRSMLLLAVPTAAFLYLYGGQFVPRAAVLAAGPTFRMLSFNVAAGRGYGQAEPVVGLILAEKPDLVALQEVRDDALETIGAVLRDGYPYQGRSDDGVILSRAPILEMYPFRPDTGGHEGLVAEVVINDRIITLFNAHPFLPTAYPRWRREGLRLARQYNTNDRNDAVTELLEQLEAVGGPRLLVGDFNMSPTSFAHRLITTDLRDSYEEVGWGFGHTVPANFEPTAPNISMPLFRVDYIFHSPEIAALRTWVGPYTHSNHLPVIADLQIVGP